MKPLQSSFPSGKGGTESKNGRHRVMQTEFFYGLSRVRLSAKLSQSSDGFSVTLSIESFSKEDGRWYWTKNITFVKRSGYPPRLRCFTIKADQAELLLSTESSGLSTFLSSLFPLQPTHS